MSVSSAARPLVLLCSLLSGACTLHVTTGPGSAAYRGDSWPAPTQRVSSAPRPRRAQAAAPTAAPSSPGPSAPVLVSGRSHDTDQQAGPSSNAPVRVDRSLGAGRQLPAGDDERVPPFVTSSHTRDPKQSLAGADRAGIAAGTRPVAVRQRALVKDALPGDDGRYQRVAQRRDANAQPAGPSDE